MAKRDNGFSNGSSVLPRKFGNAYLQALGIRHLKSGAVQKNDVADRARRTVIQNSERILKPQIEDLINEEAVRNFQEAQEERGITYDDPESAEQDIICRLRPLLNNITAIQLDYASQMPGFSDKAAAREKLFDIRDKIEDLFLDTDCPFREQDAEDCEVNPAHFDKRQFATTSINRSVHAIYQAIGELIEEQGHASRLGDRSGQDGPRR